MILKKTPPTKETWVGLEALSVASTLEKKMATHTNILVLEIP